MRFPTVNMSELRKLEASIGFTSGILVGAVSAGILILFFTDWQWYFKLFSGIGSLSIIGTLYMALSELIKARRSLLEAMGEMEIINSNMSDENKDKLEELNKELLVVKDELEKQLILDRIKDLQDETEKKEEIKNDI